MQIYQLECSVFVEFFVFLSYCFKQKHCFPKLIRSALSPSTLFSEVMPYICNTVTFIYHKEHSVMGPPDRRVNFLNLHAIKVTLYALQFFCTLTNYIELCIHHHSTIENSSLTLKIPVFHPYSFAFPMSYKWNHMIGRCLGPSSFT